MYRIFGVLVQLVRMLPCHGRGRGFESHTYRKLKKNKYKKNIKKILIFLDNIIFICIFAM